MSLDDITREIQELYRKAKEQEDRAALPHCRSAGEKLLEARAQMSEAKFASWVKRHFGLSLEKARALYGIGLHPSQMGEQRRNVRAGDFCL